MDIDRAADLPFLTGNQCEAVKRRELRVPLLEIPQEGEDPMSLSVGTKGDGGTLAKDAIQFLIWLGWLAAATLDAGMSGWLRLILLSSNSHPRNPRNGAR